MTSSLNDKELSILETVSAKNLVSQRELSGHIGLSLGVTNALLQKLIKMELLTVQQTNKKRREYHLTRRGLQQKNSKYHFNILRTIQAYRELESQFVKAIQVHLNAGFSEIILSQSDEISEAFFQILKNSFSDNLVLKRSIVDSHAKSLLLRFGTSEVPVNFKGRVVDVLQEVFSQ